MRILVSGSSGLIGRALVEGFAGRGESVGRLLRSEAKAPGDLSWDPASGRFDAARAEGVDAVVHLAGESIAARRWSDAQKSRIRDSRVRGTRLLAEGFASLARRPRVLVAASAIGFYGDTGDREMDEQFPPGDGFLAEVCREWEAATEAARRAGIRVVNLRLGVVLSEKGGALAQMLPIFRLGLGGRVGDGAQWMSWVSLEDVVGVVGFVIGDDATSGAVNAVAPEPVRNLEFARTLARVLRRPAFLPVPAVALRVALGEMASELLLSSSRVVPGVLLRRGYRFVRADLESALRSLLG